MFREYEDTRIKRNLQYVRKFSLVALIMVVIIQAVYLISKWVLYDWMVSHPQDLSISYIRHFWGGMDLWKEILSPDKTTDLSSEISWDFIYCFWYFYFAFLTYIFSRSTLQKPAISKQSNEDMSAPKQTIATKGRIIQWAEKLFVESKFNNDISNMLTCIIFNFIPVAVFVFSLLSVIIASMVGTLGDISDCVSSVAYHLGYMLLSHIFLIISNGFLIQNRVLIKREWRTNPPSFLLKKQQEAQKQKAERDTATCKELLEECGMQFFIEYYPQLKRLPLRDVVVSDHYLPEKQVRLPAAKKIVDAGLSACALHYIIETFGDVFSEEAIGRAKTLLNEIENKKGEIK